MSTVNRRSSLVVSAASLLIATLASNALGLVFWAVAARSQAPHAVGRAAAMVAALTLVATVGQLNLGNVFVRLLPAAGHLGAHLVRRGYLAVIIATLGLGGIYAGTGLSAGVIGGGVGARILFMIAATVLALFALEDFVLTALRLTPWIPVENISVGVARLVMLPVVLFVAGSGALAVAWVIPAAIAVAAVSSVLFGRVLPRRANLPGSVPSRRKLMSFVAGEYAGSICSTATVQLMPLLVAWRLGAAEVAYLTVPWMIASGIALLLWNVASSLVVELISPGPRSDALLRRSVMIWAGVVLAALAVCTLGAHPLLDIVGKRYAAYGVPLLRIVGLSTPFAGVITICSTLMWLDQRVWRLAAFLAASGAAQLTISLVLLPHLGVVAVGWASLVTQAGEAAVMAPLAARRISRGTTLEVASS